MGGLTLDTGALIALERSRKRVLEAVATAQAGRAGNNTITVPAVVMTEWWRGTSKRRPLIRAMFDVEPLDERLAKTAGEALASLPKGTDVDASLTIDAIVMASAARRGDVVYTADRDDLELFGQFFPNVKVFTF